MSQDERQDVSEGMVAMLPRLRAFARALARNADDADDLVQLTCERALAAQASYAAGTRLDSWLFRIMRNLFIDGYRRRRPQVPIDTPEIEASLGGEDGRRTSENRLEVADVQAIIAQLPEDQRSVLVLVCVEEMKYREVADILDMPIGTVMSRLARARASIAEALETNVVSLRPADPGRARHD